HPPYKLLQNTLLDVSAMQNLKRFARYWDLVGNSGNFVETVPLIWNERHSPFQAFMRWSEWLHARLGRTDSIALARLMELLFEFLTRELSLDPHRVAEVLWRDYQRGGRRDKPQFLKDFLLPNTPVSLRANRQSLPKRQAR